MHVAALAVVAFTGLLCVAGCGRPRTGIAPPVRLEALAGYPVLAPGDRPATAGAGVQSTLIALGPLAGPASASCIVNGAVFSLTPPSPRTRGQWTVTSPSLQGWQMQRPDVDLRAEWFGFARSVMALQSSGCFRAGMTGGRAQQMIAEAVPVPADESLVFRYGFSGSGVVDLLPGMMLQVERSVLVDKGARRELQSMEADYEVVAAAGGGVALHRTRAVSLHRPQTSDEIFHLVRLVADAPRMRLFLQSAAASGSIQRPSILVSAASTAALETGTQGVDTSGCPARPATGANCLTFHEAVSLLIACNVNGRTQYLPMGTSLASLLDLQHGSLERVSVQRQMADGRYAPVEFARTQEAAVHILLQNGDRVHWE